LGHPLKRRDSLIGAKLGPYEIVRLIGHGGTATVFEARHGLLAKRVAIKILHEHLADDPEVLARFLREGRVASQLHHPNTLEVVDVGEESGVAYLVVELLEGETLHARLASRKVLELSETLEVLLPIAAALAYAHARGIVHRDIKPANVFLAQGGGAAILPKLIDFGLSKTVDAGQKGALTATGVLIGTAAYMAPEQTMDMKLVTAKSDQYSLATVLYECISGRAPYSGDGFFELLEAVRAGGAPPPSALDARIPKSVDDAVMRALAPDPAARFPDVRAFATALLPFASADVAEAWRAASAPRAAAASAPNVPSSRREASWFTRVLRSDAPDAAPREPAAQAVATEPADARARAEAPAPPSPSAVRARGEVVVPFVPDRAHVPVATHIRSTMITSSIATLRSRGLFDAYQANLDPAHREAVCGAVAGLWLPIALGIAHYEACNKLRLGTAELLDIGDSVGERMTKSALSVVVKLAAHSGVTPWTMLSQSQRIWERTFQGSAAGVVKLGPKEARLELVSWPLARIEYNRVSFRGILRALLHPFCTRAYVHEVTPLCTPTTLGYRIAWA
jgi:serine/threonine protein kinase